MVSPTLNTLSPFFSKTKVLYWFFEGNGKKMQKNTQNLTKKCSKCRKIKILRNFTHYKDRYGKSYYYSHCKDCRFLYGKKKLTPIIIGETRNYPSLGVKFTSQPLKKTRNTPTSSAKIGCFDKKAYYPSSVPTSALGIELPVQNDEQQLEQLIGQIAITARKNYHRGFREGVEKTNLKQAVVLTLFLFSMLLLFMLSLLVLMRGGWI